MKTYLLSLLLFTTSLMAQYNPELYKFADEFFTWRAAQQPASGDDIPRVERPDMWIPDYSPDALIRYHFAYKDFLGRLEEIDKSNWVITDSIDYMCLRSAIERVNWELDVLKSPYNNPDFYVHQTLGVLFELLYISSPMNDNRIENIILRVGSIPVTIKHAEVNLKDPVRSFAKIALSNLEDISAKLSRVEDALKKESEQKYHSPLNIAFTDAAEALEGYKNYLKLNLPLMRETFNVGREGYEYYLKNIALLPYSPEELLLMGKMEWDRSVAFEHIEKLKNEDIPEPSIFNSIEEQIEQTRKDEESIRKFLHEKDLLTIPEWVHHYINRPFPERLAPLAYMGVTDDLTSNSRLDEDGVKYIIEPKPDMSFFWLSMAKDPRGIIIHEGVPGHYFQLVRSWGNPDFTRQHFIDPGSNEGIGFYVEEMMMQMGAVDDKPKTREMLYSYMRLRALRVDVDINLALGNYTIEEGAKYLSETVPMDYETALDETGFFAYNPGQAISYQIGKIQILNLISDAKAKLGEKFNLRKFHDYLMINGNVPIALLRWEYLGKRDQIEKLWE